MRILILGGTAFIGPPTVQALASKGHDLALFHRGKTKSDLPEGVGEFIGDRGNLPDHGKALNGRGPDVVLDMFPLSESDATAVQDLFRGTASRVVALSSCDVYRAYGVLTGKETGPPDPVPLAEDAPLRKNLFPYRGLSERMHDYEKILVETVYLGDPDLPGAIVRLPMVYGPRDYQHRLFPYLKPMDDGRPAILLSERNAAWRCSRGYVENMAHAIVLAVEREEGAGRVFNAAEPEAFEEKAWVEKVAEAAGWKGEIAVLPQERLPAHLQDESVLEQPLVVDTASIRSVLGYKETVPLEEGLRRTVAWERKNPPKTFDPGRYDYEAEDKVLGTGERDP
jgi:nucleoside-diphosphate-sugar epimerase